jgi:hypothetical protein
MNVKPGPSSNRDINQKLCDCVTKVFSNDEIPNTEVLYPQTRWENYHVYCKWIGFGRRW